MCCQYLHALQSTVLAWQWPVHILFPFTDRNADFLHLHQIVLGPLLVGCMRLADTWLFPLMWMTVLLADEAAGGSLWQPLSGQIQEVPRDLSELLC